MSRLRESEHVAGVIYRALTTRNPRARYPASPQARIMIGVMPRLSDRLRDGVWRQMIKLPRRVSV